MCLRRIGLHVDNDGDHLHSEQPGARTSLVPSILDFGWVLHNPALRIDEDQSMSCGFICPACSQR